MSYTLKVTFPKEENPEASKIVINNRKELVGDLSFDQVLDVVRQYERGYACSFSFVTPKEEVEDVNPFETAKQLELAGVDYRASLTVKTKGDFSRMEKVMQAVESHGFDLNVSVKMQINDKSPINTNKPSTWTAAEFATYTVTPKASSDDINELKGLYDDLADDFEVLIKVKPKKIEDNEGFVAALRAHPDGTEIQITLSDAPY